MSFLANGLALAALMLFGTVAPPGVTATCNPDGTATWFVTLHADKENSFVVVSNGNADLYSDYYKDGDEVSVGPLPGDWAITITQTEGSDGQFRLRRAFGSPNCPQPPPGTSFPPAPSVVPSPSSTPEAPVVIPPPMTPPPTSLPSTSTTGDPSAAIHEYGRWVPASIIWDFLASLGNQCGHIDLEPL